MQSKFEELDCLLAKADYGAAELERLHKQSKCDICTGSSGSSYLNHHRPKLVAWLLTSFDTMGLRDEWLVNSIYLLDRVFLRRAARSWRINCAVGNSDRHEENVARVLSIILISLKISSAEAETNVRVREIIFFCMKQTRKPLNFQRTWRLIFQMELQALHLIEFRAAQPTPIDLVGRLAFDIALAAPVTETWAGLATVEVVAFTRSEKEGQVHVPEKRPLFVVCSRFLVELALLHGGQETYQIMAGTPLVLAIAAVRVSVESFGGHPPEACLRVIMTSEHLLTGHESDKVAACTSFLRKCWSMNSSRHDVPVLEK